jgi:hypothetical protein
MRVQLRVIEVDVCLCFVKWMAWLRVGIMCLEDWVCSWISLYFLHSSCFMDTVHWGGICVSVVYRVNGDGLLCVLDTH